MVRHLFIQVGDTFKSQNETKHFHKDMTYVITHVFNNKGKILIYIADKYGKDIVFEYNRFHPTSKTVTSSEALMMRSRLDFFWENNLSPFVISKTYHYDFEKTEFIELNSKAYFGGAGNENVIAYVKRYIKSKAPDRGWLHNTIEGSEVKFTSKQQYYDYFKEFSVDDFKMIGTHSQPQEYVDMMFYLLRCPQFDESILNQPEEVNNTEIDWVVHRTKPNLDEFLTLTATVIFDEEELSDDNKKVIYNIIEAFELLPKSHGPTSVAKVLMGKSKKKNSTVEHLFGTCLTLKQPQFFTLANMVDSFMYINKVFLNADDKETEEWLGAYEYIGSKRINTKELVKIKEKLK